MAHTFRLITPDGEPLGLTELQRPDWPAGSIIYRGGAQPNLRVLDILSGSDDPEQLPTLVVEDV
jgi:hypothetical protein